MGIEERLPAEPRFGEPVFWPRLKGGQVPALAPFLADVARVLESGAGVIVVEVVLLPLRLPTNHFSVFRVLHFPSVFCKGFRICNLSFVFCCA